MTQTTFEKRDVLAEIGDADKSALRKYQDFFVGSRKFTDLVRYEAAQVLALPMPGAIGYAMRKMLVASLLGHAGTGVQFGRNVSIRHPSKVSIGDRSALDDECFLDARGIEAGRFNIGKDVMIARGTTLAAKSEIGYVEIGDHCTIGKDCVLVSTGGIRLGSWVGIADTCYLGGGRYQTDRLDLPMMQQQPYANGPIVIEDDCWIGAGVYILDGVTIGRGSVIGAGAVVRENVPARTVVTPHQRLIMLPRNSKSAQEQAEDVG